MNKMDDKHRLFIEEHACDSIHRLLLSAGRYPEIDMQFVVRQIEGRKKAASKFPSLTQFADFLYPVKLSMEQCSSEPTARFKASLVEGDAVADLTGGLGIDALFMSQKTASYCYIERNLELMQIAAHNFKTCGVSVESHCNDGLDFLRQSNRHFDTLYIDPARRDENHNKIIRFAACEPDVPSNLTFLFQFCKRILIKASPMLDISMAIKELGCVEKVYVVAVKNECKELLIECRPGSRSYTIVCVNLEGEVVDELQFTPDQESAASVEYAPSPGVFLYEPNAAVMKAGAFRLVAERYGLWKLHPDTHLYTSDKICADFPGRIFRVESVVVFDKRLILQMLPEKKANLAVRNFPARPDELKKKLGIIDGGEIYLFAATFSHGDKRIVFCSKL